MFKQLIRTMRTGITLAMLMLAATMVGCGNEEAPAAEAAPAAKEEAAPTEAAPAAAADTAESGEAAADTAVDEWETCKIAFITADMANESQAYGASQFEKYGPKYNFEVTVLNAQGDPQVEAQVVTNCIAQGFKAIYLNPNDINGIVPSVMEAHEAGVIVGLFSSDLPESARQYRDFFVGVDDNMAGETAGKAFLDHFPDGAKIVEIGGQAGHDAQIKRHDGFNKAIAGSAIEVLDYQCPTTWSTSEAMAIMEDFIVKYGDQIQGVFCHWDNGATGVIEALKAAGRDDVFVIGVDGCRAGFDQVKAGTQAATIMQNFTTFALTELERTRAKIEGEDFQVETFVPLDVVTLENIDQFEYPEW